MLVLRSTLDERDITQASTQNYAGWGTSLSLEQYIERDKIFLKTKYFTRNQVWIYVDDSSGKIVCSCDTNRLSAVMVVNGTTVMGDCLAIANVFTPAKHRRQGFASRMMIELREIIKKMDGAIASTLYSEVGPEFYGSKGWEYYPPKVLQFHIPDDFGVDTQLNDPKCIGLKELEALLAFDVTSIMSAMTEGDFFIIPHIDAFEWFHVKECFYCKIFFPGMLVVSIGVSSGTDYITWFHDFVARKLYITHIRDESNHGVRFLNEAIREAVKYKLSKVVMWHPSARIVKEAQSGNQGFQLIEQQDSLSSLMILDDATKNVQWKHNEKYAWL